MAENMDVNFKDNNTWHQDYANAYNNAIATNSNVVAAHHKVREAQITCAGNPVLALLTIS